MSGSGGTGGRGGASGAGGGADGGRGGAGGAGGAGGGSRRAGGPREGADGGRADGGRGGARGSGGPRDGDGPGQGGAPGVGAGGVLVIGYGNALRSDDGVGIHAAGLLALDPRLARVDVRSAHQLVPELAADFAEVGLVVLVDASAALRPGELAVRRLAVPGAGDDDDPDDPAAGAGGGDSSAAGGGPTSHHVGAGELVALAAELYGAAPAVVTVSVGVETMELGEVLSPAVAAALPGVADAVARLVAAHEGRVADGPR